MSDDDALRILSEPGVRSVKVLISATISVQSAIAVLKVCCCVLEYFPLLAKLRGRPKFNSPPLLDCSATSWLVMCLPPPRHKHCEPSGLGARPNPHRTPDMTHNATQANGTY